MFPAPEPVEIPDHLTADLTLEIFTSLVNGMETALRDMLAHAKSEGITDAKQAMEEFQHLYLEHVEQLSNALMKTHGVTQEVCCLLRCDDDNKSLGCGCNSLMCILRCCPGLHGGAAKDGSGERRVPPEGRGYLRQAGQDVSFALVCDVWLELILGLISNVCLHSCISLDGLQFPQHGLGRRRAIDERVRRRQSHDDCIEFDFF